MATWGKKTIKVNKYEPETTLYYDYNTTVDAYYFRYKGQEDYGLGYEQFDVETRMSQEQGEAMMEALINHILYFECSGDEEKFMEEYVKNNRFRNQK
jgi:hypothetical protein